MPYHFLLFLLGVLRIFNVKLDGIFMIFKGCENLFMYEVLYFSLGLSIEGGLGRRRRSRPLYIPYD
jgi:hypothetical protein